MNIDYEESEDRNTTIKIYLTENEKEEISKKAKKERMSMSSYCRRKIFS